MSRIVAQCTIKPEEMLVGQLFLSHNRDGLWELFSIVNPKSGVCRAASTGITEVVDPCAEVTVVTVIQDTPKPPSRCGVQATEVLCAFLQVPQTLRKYVLCELVSNLDA